MGGNGQSVIVDPAGRVLHQAQAAEAFMPIEIDLDIVRRQRERGLLGLGQPLKSFRDCKVDFTVYDRSGSTMAISTGSGRCRSRGGRRRSRPRRGRPRNRRGEWRPRLKL